MTALATRGVASIASHGTLTDDEFALAKAALLRR